MSPFARTDGITPQGWISSAVDEIHSPAPSLPPPARRARAQRPETDGWGQPLLNVRRQAQRAVTGAVWALACSGQQQASPPPAPSPPPAQAPAEPAPAPADPEPASEPSESAPSEPAPAAAAKEPPKEPLSSLCNEMCDAVAPKCTSLQIKSCKSTCDNYDGHPAACDGVVRAALSCAREDKDFLFCANVVPDSCAKEFKAIDICAETGKPPVQESARGLPDGWQRFSLGGGASVAVPGGMKKQNGNPPRWSVQATNGARYEVEIHPVPSAGGALKKVYLREARKLFGRCSDKMKLHGLIEKPDRSSMQYRMVCPEDTKRVGILHIVGQRLYVLSAFFPKDESIEIDAFLYSFETK